MTDYDGAATAELVRNLTLAAEKPHELKPGAYYVVYDADGELRQIDLTEDRWLDFPRRKQGTVTVRDIPAFAHYWSKHHDSDSEVFADLDGGTVTAVLDAHRGTDDEFAARWQQHRLTLQLQHTDAWKEWTKLDGALLPQPDFAEFIEDHAKHVYAPDSGSVSGADLLEIAQHFKANTKVAFTSGHLIANGQTQLEFTEDIQASAKTNHGTIQVPNQFAIAIKPYDDCDLTVITTRFRYRLEGGRLSLGFRLDDAKGIARNAVRYIVDKLADECDVTVMHGRPAT